MKTTKTILNEMGACSEAVKWAGRKTHKEAWETCKRGDWLLWIASKLDIDRKKLVPAACACARTALKYVPVGEDRPRIAIETAEAWTRGEATIEQVRTATLAANAAANAAASAAADAASAAIRAAYAAIRAAYAAANAAAYAAANAAASAAARAASAAADAASAAIRAAARKDIADIVREIIPFSVIRKAIAEYEGKA
jgi:multidrug resistance efflux pump